MFLLLGLMVDFLNFICYWFFVCLFVCLLFLNTFVYILILADCFGWLVDYCLAVSVGC